MIYSRFKWSRNSYLELKDVSSAYIYYRHKRVNLITGFPETYSFHLFLNELEKISLQEHFKIPRVYHFYFELGAIINGLGHLVNDETPLVMEIEYQKSGFKTVKTPRLKSISLKSIERPSWSEYKQAFAMAQEHLLNGNCYQLNLTYPYDFETEDYLDPREIADYFFYQKNISSYAHLTVFHDEMILSNSPECLFHYQNNKLITMPIKGTIKRSRSLKTDWKQLMENKKEEAELLMITDLLKNDLNRLDLPQAKVMKLRAPLIVPQLLHQYSLIEVNLEHKVSLNKVIHCLFPGGSVTGAPKKRVLEILSEIERYSRGIYCGSTLLCYKDKKVANINIRTASVSLSDRLWRYSAGGGITLLSRPVHEFNEMEAKLNSFLTLLKTPGY
ncbi:MAG: chorismate-binding protein [Bacteriovoracaceae bacterium]